MPERRPNIYLDEMRSHLVLAKIRLQFAFEDAIANTKYNFLVPQKEHETGINNARIFTSEALDFLKDNTASKLSLLLLSKTQLELVSFLIQSVYRKKLLLRKVSGKLTPNKNPYVLQQYETIFKTEGSRKQSDTVQIVLSTRMGIRPPLAPTFGITGHKYLENMGGLDFYALPKKPESPDELDKMLGNYGVKKRMESRTYIINNGNQIVSEVIGTAGGVSIDVILKHYFLGSFDGVESGNTYFLYGNNSNLSNISIEEKEEKREYNLNYAGNPK